jgi:hypothetical protein
MARTWTDTNLINAVQSESSIAGVLRKLNLRPVGGNYQSIKNHIKRLNLNTGHWTGQGWRKGSTNAVRKARPLDEVLVANSPTTATWHLRNRLINAGLLEARCSQCFIVDWQGQPLSLHLDHTNGDRTDNRIDNLRLLCPNCHSQTPTYCQKK